MGAKTSQDLPRSGLTQGPAMRKRLGQIFILWVVQAIALFLPAGSPQWTMAWVYLALYAAFVVANAAVLLKKNPGVIAERAEVKSGAKPWDLVIGWIFGLTSLLALVVPGLGFRFHWPAPPGLTIHLAAAAVFVAGYSVFGWAMASNPFFSTVVRIQRDRGHTVVTAGPYRLVRHPAYSSQVFTLLATPVMLGCWWGLIPAALAIAVLVVRTALEDRTLRTELSGYAQYAGRVRYRLLPGVW